MNDEQTKNKLKIEDIINEITYLRKYNNSLLNNISGETLENYLNELNKSIIKAQNKAEDILTKDFK